MKVHTTNYTNTFITVSDDCRATRGEIPPEKNRVKTVAGIQFDLVSNNPYRFTSDEILFQVYAERKGFTNDELPSAREQFFSKGQPCFRASPLPKQYGWGVHNNPEGKVALFGCETPGYENLSTDPKLKIVKAMKSSKT